MLVGRMQVVEACHYVCKIRDHYINHVRSELGITVVAGISQRIHDVLKSRNKIVNLEQNGSWMHEQQADDDECGVIHSLKCIAAVVILVGVNQISIVEHIE